MNLKELIDKVIEIGIIAVNRDYADDEYKRDGSTLGFNECKDKNPLEIGELLQIANKATIVKHREQAKDYWYWRCRAAEIEWVANVVSAVLYNEGQATIVPPTYRGMIMANEILSQTATA